MPPGPWWFSCGPIPSLAAQEKDEPWGYPGRKWPKAFWVPGTAIWDGAVLLSARVFAKLGNGAFPGPSAGPGEAPTMLVRETLALHLLLLFVLLKKKAH